MNIYTFNIGDQEVDVKAESQSSAEAKVSHYDFPILTHYNGKSVLVGLPYKMKEYDKSPMN